MAMQPTPSTRALWVFASLWSLRQYPTARREWSWQRKFAAIAKAGFDGVFSPPMPGLRARGELRYLAVASLGGMEQVKPAFTAAAELGALAIDLQLGDNDTPLTEAVKLAVHVRKMAHDLNLPFAIETHRGTFTQSPEVTLAFCERYAQIIGERPPLCLDHSHFADIRHQAPAKYWERLREPHLQLDTATQFHLRPFNGHHCQIPVLDIHGRRTPEYRAWLEFARPLLQLLSDQPTADPVLIVPELSAAPAYGLSRFGDTWRDMITVHRDLRTCWRQSAISTVGSAD